MLRMLLIVVAAVLAVKIIMNLIRSRKPENNIKGRPQRSTNSARRADDIEDADFKEIK